MKSYLLSLSASWVAPPCSSRVAPDRVRPGYLAAESSVRIPSGAPREALRPRSRPRPRIRPRGVMECWSVGLVRQFGIAPRVRGVGAAREAVLGLPSPNCTPPRGVGSAFRALATLTSNPGLKPWAQSYRPFGALSYRPVLDLSPVTFHLSHSSP
jgi:hypothetical protein